MKKVLLFAFCIVMAAGMASFAADEVDKAVAAGTDHAGKFISFKKDLGLSDEQVAKLKEIRENIANKNGSLVKEAKSLMDAVKTLSNADDPDLSAIEVKVRALEKVRTDIFMNRLSGAKASGKVLTNDQKLKLKELTAKLKGGVQTPSTQTK